MMTLHAAKGLEFPVVYILAVEQGILPHERSMAKDEDIEEERRLAFVGMTPAMEELYLSHARMREFRGQTLYAVPSMFLDELPELGVERIDLSQSGAGRKKALDYWRSASPGARLARRRHSSQIDEGTCRGLDGNRSRVRGRHGRRPRHVWPRPGDSGVRPRRPAQLKIRFQKAGERTFLANKARLKIVQQA